MKLIPLKKRILYYLALLPISLIVAYLSTILIIVISGNRETGMEAFVIPTLLITNYIFGAIFLKIKLIFKLIVPFIVALIAFGGLWIVVFLNLKTNLFDIYGYWDFIIQVFLVFVIVWEIAYQILKIITNQINHSSDNKF